MLMLGPEAMQFVTYARWKLRGVWGGLIAGLLFMLPGAAVLAALALSEKTPGLLILVKQFVAMLAGFREGGIETALLSGVLALWVTFVLCFLWIFTGPPYLDRILAQPRLRGANAAISAVVVGVIANLSFRFALDVLFGRIISTPFGAVPVWATLSWTAAALTGLAAILMVALRTPMLPALAMMALAGAAAHWWA